MAGNLDLTEKTKSSEPRVFKLSVSAVKGDKKENVASVHVIAGAGIEGDAHCGSDRPISLLPFESFALMKNDKIEINPGDFAENITTIGLDFKKIKIGAKIALGETILLEVTRIGKECHNGCIIKETVGDCIMPRQGIFASPLTGGVLREGDKAKIINQN